MRRLPFILMVMMLPGCSGCGESLPDSPAELKQVAVESRDDAQAARKAGNPKTAAAAERAETAVAKLIEIHDASEELTGDDRAMRKAAVLAARKAREFAELAREEKELVDALDSWKAAGYRTARKLAWRGTFEGLALAAEQADGTDLKSLPKGAQDSARLAADLANQFTGREPLPNGEPAWKGIAADMKTLADPMPAEQAQFLALALLLAGQKDLALYEIELIDESAVPAGEPQLYFHLLNGIIYSIHDWQHLAVLEIDKIPEDDRGDSSELLAGVHLTIAYFHLRSEEYEAADPELVRSMQIWPNNPFSVFLTGERLAASGEYEQAAKSLEDLAKNSDEKWFAKRIAARARELRDSPEEGQSLLYDKAFMTEVVLKYVWMSAEKSEPAAQVKQTIENARRFGGRVLQRIPGMSDLTE